MLGPAATASRAGRAPGTWDLAPGTWPLVCAAGTPDRGVRPPWCRVDPLPAQVLAAGVSTLSEPPFSFGRERPFKALVSVCAELRGLLTCRQWAHLPVRVETSLRIERSWIQMYNGRCLWGVPGGPGQQVTVGCPGEPGMTTVCGVSQGGPVWQVSVGCPWVSKGCRCGRCPWGVPGERNLLAVRCLACGVSPDVAGRWRRHHLAA